MFESGMEKARAALLKLTAARAELEDEDHSGRTGGLTALRRPGEPDHPQSSMAATPGRETRARIAELTRTAFSLRLARDRHCWRASLWPASLQPRPRR